MTTAPENVVSPMNAYVCVVLSRLTYVWYCDSSCVSPFSVVDDVRFRSPERVNSRMLSLHDNTL